MKTLTFFYSKECLIAFGFLHQDYSKLKELNDIGCFHSNSSSIDAFIDNHKFSDVSTISASSAKSNKIIVTQRQLDVIQLVVIGNTNKEIAFKLYISKSTVESLIYNLFKRFNLNNRIHLATFCKMNEDNFCIKGQPLRYEEDYKDRRTSSNLLSRQIKELYFQGIVSYHIVAHMTGCSKEHARVTINKLNRASALDYFTRRLKSGMNERLLSPRQ